MRVSRRLAPDGQSDCWWECGRNAEEAAAAADKLVDFVHRGALQHFERFGTFPTSFDAITPEALAAGDFSVLPGYMTPARAGLVMARIAAHLGQTERAHQFAEIGLADISPPAGVALVPELEALAARGRTP